MTERIRGRTSVIIVSWQVRELLRACLTSIAQYEGETALDICVVDNASTDGSAAMVATAFPWVRLIALDHNPGFAAANNIALRQAPGDVCVLLNPDTRLTDAAISRLAAYLRTHRECGVVGPRLLNPNGTVQSAGFAPPSLFQVWYDLVPWPRRFYTSRLNGRYTSESGDAPYDIGFPLGAALAVRGEVFDTIGLLDEGYGMYMEEPDLCARVWAAGWAVRLLPDVTIIHHGGQSTGQMSEAMFLALHRARRRFYARFRPQWWNTAARTLVRTGCVVAAGRELHAHRRGKTDEPTYHRRIQQYGCAWRLWGEPLSIPLQEGKIAQ